jgi:hypothetical protein
VAAASTVTRQTPAEPSSGLGRADRFLLASIGSRGDTLTDKQVLQDLRDWNAAPWETSPHLSEAK